MRKQLKLDINNTDQFKTKLLLFSKNYNEFAYLDSNSFVQKNTKHSNYEYDFLIAFDSIYSISGNGNKDFDKIEDAIKKYKDWMFGFLSYDLKNELETLHSNNPDNINFPLLHFFIPRYVFTCKQDNLQVHYEDSLNNEQDIYNLINEIDCLNNTESINKHGNFQINARFSKQEYIETVEKIKNHIHLGDVYEINFCQEFYGSQDIDPISTFIKLRNYSPTPFSSFYKIDDKYLISASPERFIKKTGNKIISQPIKGTKKRSSDPKEDEILKNNLLEDPKEKAENVMIVDLVRNDLSKTAIKGSVKVEELFGIYSFAQVHQMISTISSEVDTDINLTDIIKTTFPMGSMTGAPKIRAMELIENYEKSKRGLYSGSVGYITPDKDFDFNVVIRSILYNQLKKYVSFTVGGAITSLANPEDEYEECLLKARAMKEVLK